MIILPLQKSIKSCTIRNKRALVYLVESRPYIQNNCPIISLLRFIKLHSRNNTISVKALDNKIEETKYYYITLFHTLYVASL